MPQYDLSEPYIGYRSAGRRPEANNDRTASANAPLSALRGYAAGTAGLPGDIEGLARAGLSQLPPQLLTAFPALRAFGIGSRADPTPQLPTTDFYNEYLPGANLNQTPTGKAFTSAGNLLGGTGATSIARLGIKSTAGLADLAARIAAEAPRSGSRAAQLGVIKLPGAAGNFLKDNVENSLKPLKQDAWGRPIEDGLTYGYQPPVTPETTALNNWIDKQLTRYIKNDMATSNDPIRALAERGITHAEIPPTTYDLGRIRKELGFPEEGMGVSPQAKAWESKSDSFINSVKASDMTDGPNITASIDNPWLLKVPPETPVYELLQGSYGPNNDLGFQHLIDELRNATDLASGLPSNLRLKSSSLPQLSVPQAVERVSQINAWRAAEAIKAEKAGMMGNLSANSRLEDPTTQLSFVDKPGMKWVDIPETTDKIGLNLCTTIGKQGGWCTQGEGLAKSYGSGPNRLTTLIDADGRPHAQAKITSGFNIEDPREAVDNIMETMSAAEQRKFNKYIGSDEFATYGEFDHEEVLAWLQSNMPKSYKRYLASVSGPSNITEIKPVSNDFSSARALEYKSRDPQYQNKITNSTLKFLNSGEWGSVTDLDHFNIVDLRNPSKIEETLKGVLNYESPKNRVKKFNEALELNPEANRFMTFSEFKKFVGSDYAHYAAGGAVHFDEGGAAFGVFPQMKPRRAQQDRTAAANAPLSALRGYAAGTAGLPGDIEGLARAGISQLPPQLLTAFPALRAFGIGSRADPTPQLPTTEFYNEYLPGAQLNATPTGKLFTGAGNVLGGTGATSIARLGIKSTAELADLAARIAAESPRSGSRAAQLGIVKLPNGNFLTGRTEKDLSSLKQDTTGRPIEDAVTYGYQPPVTPETTALNNWVDSNLTNYVKKQMGTADDPVRKLAEQGITHKPALLDEYLHEPLSGEQMRRAESVKKQRRKAGFPEEGLGQSPMAKAWEISSDEVIAAHRAGDIQGMPEKFAKRIEAKRKMVAAREELDKNFLEQHENSGLDNRQKTALMRRFSDLEKATMLGDDNYKNLRHEYLSADIPRMDDYMELGRQNPYINKLDPETPMYAPFTGDLGFDHIMDVLREDVTAGRIRPEQLSKVSMEQAVRRTYQYDQELAAKANASRAAAREGLPTYREYPEGYKWIQLNKPGTFAQESDAMGHSVRGYEPPKGHPDWVEASGDAGSLGYGHGGWEAIKSGKAKVYSLVDSKGAPHATVEVKTKGVLADTDFGANDARIAEGRGDFGERGYRTTDNQFFETYADAVSHEKAIQKPTPQELKEPPSITQIKGKQNRAPNEEYLPYIQDFVKGGQWSDVRDLRNAGLHDARVAGKAMEGRPAFMTDEEWAELVLKKPLSKPEGMAQGGLVSNHFDPIKIKQIIAGLDDEYDPENIQQIIAQRESAYA